MCALTKSWLVVRENSHVQKNEETKILLWGNENFSTFEKPVGVGLLQPVSQHGN